MLDKTQQQLDLYYGTRGPQDAPVVLVGESWGSDEKRAQKPFIGSSGTELERILANAQIDSSKVLFTNVIAEQPRANETWRFFHPKETYGTAPKVGGLAPTDLIRSEVARLYRQILDRPRSLIIATGNYALWALSRCTGAKVQSSSSGRLIPLGEQTWTPNGIMDWRGSMCYAQPHEEFFPADMSMDDWKDIKLLPIVHPAAIQRAWYMRDPTIHDLKTRVPLALANDWRCRYEFLAPPTFDECYSRLLAWLTAANDGKRIRLAVDIETARGLITCLGIADSAVRAMSIPFIKRTEGSGFDSWFTTDDEASLTALLRAVLTHPMIEIDGQNFVYDIQYIQRWLGVTPHLSHDTMLHQNVCFPGTPKALEYLSSLYCHYHWYWKEDHKEWDMKGSIEDLLNYNCLDCVRTWEIGENQRLVTKALGMEVQFDLKMQTNHLCLRMMNRGVRFDKARRAPLLFELQEALAQLHRELLSIIPQDWVAPVGKRSREKGGGEIFWVTSDKQQKKLFYDFLGFKHVHDPKTGQLTSGKKAIGQFKLWYPEFMGLFNRLEQANSLEQAVGVLKSEVDSDGRIRCSYNPGGAETHRLSSSANAFGGGTNLQNLTKGDEDD